MESMIEVLATLKMNDIHVPHDIAELTWMREKMAASGAKVYVEIGARFGASFYAIGQAFEEGSYLMAIDLPNGPWGKPKSEDALRVIGKALSDDGYHTELVFGDSQSPTTTNEVLRLLAEIPEEVRQDGVALFIDGDHSYKGVSGDLSLYKALLPDVTVIGFHDIQKNPQHLDCEVWKLWEELVAGGAPHDCLVSVPCQYGVGVIYSEK